MINYKKNNENIKKKYKKQYCAMKVLQIHFACIQLTNSEINRVGSSKNKINLSLLLAIFQIYLFNDFSSWILFEGALSEGNTYQKFIKMTKHQKYSLVHDS